MTDSDILQVVDVLRGHPHKDEIMRDFYFASDRERGLASQAFYGWNTLIRAILAQPSSETLRLVRAVREHPARPDIVQEIRALEVMARCRGEGEKARAWAQVLSLFTEAA